ncbi:MAG: hypothetical protein JW795_00665 [Chitinivibrionales bacterium]|nr:hypothetical protein [Chitinivibrionales bacterium]
MLVQPRKPTFFMGVAYLIILGILTAAGMETAGDSTLRAPAPPTVQNPPLSDSARKRQDRRLLLEQLNSRRSIIISQFPKSIDSIFNPYQLHQYHLYQSDGTNTEEALYPLPSITVAPTAIRSNLNYYLLYGFPALQPHLLMGGTGLALYHSPTVGANLLSSAEVSRFWLGSEPGSIGYELQQATIAKPELTILWEGGVFKENGLCVRFIRPLSEKLSLAVFSNYQYFNRQRYDHSNGGMFGLFEGLYGLFNVDTTYVSHTGTNPLTQEHISMGLLQYRSDNITHLLSYKYADLHNDIIAVKSLKSLSLATVVQKRDNYGHTLTAQSNFSSKTGPFFLNNQATIAKNVTLLEYATDTISSNAKISLRGEGLYCGLQVTPSMHLSATDTLQAQLALVRETAEQYTDESAIYHYGSAEVAYRRSFNFLSMQCVSHAQAGLRSALLDDEVETAAIGQAQISVTTAPAFLRLFARFNTLDRTIAYDTAVAFVPGKTLDPFQLYGSEATFSFARKNSSLFIGFYTLSKISESSILRAWPQQILPYQQPAWSTVVNPMFGPWHGISTSSQWTFSDTKPYIKAKNLVSFQTSTSTKSMRLFLDCGFDFWSLRQRIRINNDTTWNRPIYDLHLKAAVQIKTFRLYYRIDNVLNRKISYLPGTVMPGLLFRWGFNCLLQG